MTEADRFGEWVTDRDEITDFNEDGSCVCEDNDVLDVGRFKTIYHCGGCDRQFVGDDGNAVHPADVLSTEQEGLVEYSENPSAFYYLTEQDSSVQDYVEFPDAAEEKWLWAADGLYIGYLLYRNNTLRALVIADGFRQQGHGTEFLTTWFETMDDDPLRVMAYDRTKPFLNRLDIPIEYV